MIRAYLWSCVFMLLLMIWLGYRAGSLNRNYWAECRQAFVDIVHATSPFWGALMWPLILAAFWYTRQSEVLRPVGSRSYWLNLSARERIERYRKVSHDFRLRRAGPLILMSRTTDEFTIAPLMYQRAEASVFSRPTLLAEFGRKQFAFALADEN